MGRAVRNAGGGRITLNAMLSFEPFTVQALGSPQVFQTGETYRDAPLIDYQHPHDLFMALGGSYERTVAGTRAFVEAAAVGSPAIGPPVFMHRPSAAENPAAPLSHHLLDSTHITPGVVTAGIARSQVTLEGSWFRGLEPDENARYRFARLDSGRCAGVGRGPGPQIRGAHLTTPECSTVSNLTRLTAWPDTPCGRSGRRSRRVRDPEVTARSTRLVETTVRPRPRDAFYSRLEYAAKDILGAGGRHPRGFTHFHPLSKVGALTAGYVRDIRVAREGRYGIGADVTIHRVPANLQENYGTGPLSCHVFVRYRPLGQKRHEH